MDWYPWYFQLYKADTMHLDPYQDGCYRRLIDHYMETRQPLPDNDHALARIIGDSYGNWMSMAATMVRPFFKGQKGLLFHTKCDEILNAQDIKANKLSESGKNGARKRWSKINYIDSYPNGHPIATPMGSAIAKEKRGEEKGSVTPHKPPAPISVSDLEIDMAFQRVWNAYPGIGATGEVGSAYKGAKQQAAKKFASLYRAEKNPEQLVDQIIAACAAYEAHLNRARSISKHLVTWLNNRCWEDDYQTTKGPSRDHQNSQRPSAKHQRMRTASDEALAEILADIDAREAAEQSLSITGPDRTEL